MDELMQQMADKFGDMVQAVIIEKNKSHWYWSDIAPGT